MTSSLPTGCLTAFLFDFDDTLLPTTSLCRLRPGDLVRGVDGNIGTIDVWLPGFNAWGVTTNDGASVAYSSSELTKLEPPVVDERILEQIDELASAILAGAANLAGSHVTLLTNAHETWVDTALAAYLPRTAALIDSGLVTLVSAHQSDSTNARSWKAGVVDALAASLKTRFGAEAASGLSLQVVSVGDQDPDLEAGHLLAEKLIQGDTPQRFVKTVKFLPEPTADTLLAELQEFAALLPSLCAEAGDASLRLGAMEDGESCRDMAMQGRWSTALLEMEAPPSLALIA